MQRRRQEESPCQSSLSWATVGTLNCMLIHVSGGRFKAWAAALTARWHAEVCIATGVRHCGECRIRAFQYLCGVSVYVYRRAAASSPLVPIAVARGEVATCHANYIAKCYTVASAVYCAYLRQSVHEASEQSRVFCRGNAD